MAGLPRPTFFVPKEKVTKVDFGTTIQLRLNDYTITNKDETIGAVNQEKNNPEQYGRYTEIQVATDSSFSKESIVLTQKETYAVSVQIKITEATSYVRVRHILKSGDYTPWSDPVVYHGVSTEVSTRDLMSRMTSLASLEASLAAAREGSMAKATDDDGEDEEQLEFDKPVIINPVDGSQVTLDSSLTVSVSPLVYVDQITIEAYEVQSRTTEEALGLRTPASK